jgi:lysophospholipid acyltransferase (LPLAT)-like uncharacterized protein
MKNIFLTALMTTGLVIATISQASAQFIAQSDSTPVRIYCGEAKDPTSSKMLPATLASNGDDDEPKVIVMWKSEFFGTNYTPQQRCEVVSPKFQAAYQQGRTFLTAGIDNKTGQGIICGTSSEGETCNMSNMLYTLKSYQNATVTIDRLNQQARGVSGGVIIESSGRNGVVNLRSFLRRSKR